MAVSYDRHGLPHLDPDRDEPRPPPDRGWLELTLDPRSVRPRSVPILRLPHPGRPPEHRA